MAKKDKKANAGSCFSAKGADCCCRVESLVSVDERGQMVLPKSVREKAGINPGDKLALVTWEKGDKVNCIILIKADEMAGMAMNLLGPLMKEMM